MAVSTAAVETTAGLPARTLRCVLLAWVRCGDGWWGLGADELDYREAPAMTVVPLRVQWRRRLALGRSRPFVTLTLLVTMVLMLGASAASAQLLAFPQRPKPPERHGPANG